MPLPFRRLPRSAQDPWAAPICSRPSPEQRQWEVDALLSSLSPLVRAALAAWLLAPTDLNRWPSPARFSSRRLLFSPTLGRQSAATWCALLSEELRAIRQTLDFPPEALSGLTRNGLLTVHAMRLRQLESWLWPFCAARAIKADDCGMKTDETNTETAARYCPGCDLSAGIDDPRPLLAWLRQRL